MKYKIKVEVKQDGSSFISMDISVNFHRDAQGNITPDEKGNVGYIFASVKKDDRKENVSYFLGNVRESQSREQAVTKKDAEDLPF